MAIQRKDLENATYDSAAALPEDKAAAAQESLRCEVVRYESTFSESRFFALLYLVLFSIGRLLCNSELSFEKWSIQMFPRFC